MQRIDYKQRRTLDDAIFEYHLDTARENYVIESLFDHLSDDVTLLVQRSIAEFGFVNFNDSRTACVPPYDRDIDTNFRDRDNKILANNSR